jgi:hypothetical protein
MDEAEADEAAAQQPAVARDSAASNAAGSNAAGSNGAAAPDSTRGEPVLTDAQLLPAAEAGTPTEPVVSSQPSNGRPRRRRAASRPAGPPA